MKLKVIAVVVSEKSLKIMEKSGKLQGSLWMSREVWKV